MNDHMNDHMNDQWRAEWSRHYDTIQWTATTILTGVIGALLAYSYSGKFDPVLAFFGLWLTWTAIYYAASFRKFRNVLHKGMHDGDEKEFLMNGGKKRLLRQWRVFLLTFVILSIGWLWLFWKHEKHCCAVVFSIISIVLVVLADKHACLSGRGLLTQLGKIIKIPFRRKLK